MCCVCKDYTEDVERVATYNCLNDVYSHCYPVRRKLLSKLVGHLLKKFGEEVTIFVLMDVMKNSIKASK